MTSVPTGRDDFNTTVASRIAASIDPALAPAPGAGRSKRFAYFCDDRRLLLVAGTQEAQDIDLALAYGLTWAAGKKLVLALPAGHATATTQRLPWLSDECRPDLYEHSPDGRALLMPVRSREETLAAVREQSAGDLRRGPLLRRDDELTADLPVLGQLADAVTAEHLQPAHRPGMNAWHCQGLQVLSIEATRTAVTVRAGVHHSEAGHRPHEVTLPVADRLTDAQLDEIRAEIARAVDQRLDGPAGSRHRPDEHWLQAVIRSQPDLAGISGGAVHREVAAWRPRDGAAWARGFVDLVGAGNDGSIRVVETKLSANDDTRFVLQALDYFIWATAHRESLAAALRLRGDAHVDLRLLIGAGSDGRVALSRYSRAVAKALATDIPWTFSSVTDWFEGEPSAQTEPPGTVPAGWSNAGRATGNEYVDAARTAATRWKLTSPAVDPEEARLPGPYRSTPSSAVYDFCLPLEHARLNLLPEVRERALAHFEEHRIAWHSSVRGGPTTHLLSSQVQCVNALGQMTGDPARIKAAFGSRLRIGSVVPLHDDEYLTFEWVPEKDHLGESRNGKLRRGAGNTSVDAAFRFTTTDGKAALALVEWKFTESYTRARRADAASDETRRGRYEQLVNDPAGPIDPHVLAFDHLLDEPFYQLVRQQLLAHAIEVDTDDPIEEVHVVHVVPEANHAYEASLVRDSHRALGDTVTDVWAKLNRRPDRYHRLDAGVFLDPTITSPEYAARYTIAPAPSADPQEVSA